MSEKLSEPIGRLPRECAERYEDELRGRLGLAPRGLEWLTRSEKRLGWWITGAVALIAALTRFFRLGFPDRLMFDETYYVKGANSLLRLGYEADWQGGTEFDAAFAAGDFSHTSPAGDYVVHPPLGKWIMAIGQAIFGETSPFGWRFMVALAGTLAVALLVRIALRLFLNPWLAGVAGIAMALDGMGITLSRIGILDNLLAFFVLAGFWALLRDRDWTRERLAHRVAFGPVHADGRPAAWGPRVWWRPWMLATGVFLGLACGVKWSGIYAVAVFGLVAFAWGMAARHAVGLRLWVGAAVFQEGIPAFVHLVPTAAATYVASWFSWFRDSRSWGHGWAAGVRESTPEALPFPWLPNSFNDLAHYHSQMWDFHNGLSTPHTYQSSVWQWFVQWRPVSFWWPTSEEMAGQCPSGERCVQAVTSVGNPVVWWLALLALVVVLWVAFTRFDWRAWAILSGYLAMAAPWSLYMDRTIFQFYAVAFLPFVALALTYGLGFITGALGAPHARGNGSVRADRYDDAAWGHADFIRDEPPGICAYPVRWWRCRISRRTLAACGAVVVLIILAAMFWYPIWTGQTVSYEFWRLHMWLPSWI